MGLSWFIARCFCGGDIVTAVVGMVGWPARADSRKGNTHCWRWATRLTKTSGVYPGFCLKSYKEDKHHWKIISVITMCPYAYGDGQKFKHGLHRGHGFDFFTDFFLKTVFFGFIFRFSWIRECLDTPFFWKASDNILSNTSPYHTPRRKCPSTCNPAKSKLKSKNHWLNIIKKMYPWKTNPCSSVLSVFHFFDLWPCRRLGTQQQQGINISVRIMCPYAYGDGQKIKHGLRRTRIWLFHRFF